MTWDGKRVAFAWDIAPDTAVRHFVTARLDEATGVLLICVTYRPPPDAVYVRRVNDPVAAKDKVERMLQEFVCEQTVHAGRAYP